MKLTIIVSLTQRQKATIVARDEKIPASPMSFKISKSTAAIIARMAGKTEVSDSHIYAGYGGLGSHLHVPNKVSLSTLVAERIADGSIVEGANIDHVFEIIKDALDE